MSPVTVMQDEKAYGFLGNILTLCGYESEHSVRTQYISFSSIKASDGKNEYEITIEARSKNWRKYLDVRVPTKQDNVTEEIFRKSVEVNKRLISALASAIEITRSEENGVINLRTPLGVAEVRRKPNSSDAMPAFSIIVESVIL